MRAHANTAYFVRGSFGLFWPRAGCVNAILVREEKPPAGEEPIEWLLLTSLPIETFDDVTTVIDYCG